MPIIVAVVLFAIGAPAELSRQAALDSPRPYPPCARLWSGQPRLAHTQAFTARREPARTRFMPNAAEFWHSP